jgi:lysozyme family protein
VSFLSKIFNWIISLFKKSPVVVVELPPRVPITSSLLSCTPAKPDWKELWDRCVLNPSIESETLKVCSKIFANKSRYEFVSSMTGVPWSLVAAIHFMEASLDFSTCLHNGDKLPGPTTHVPKGRGPFSSWEDAAIDALRYDGLNKVSYDSAAVCLAEAEKYNGLGYRSHGIFTPYNCSGTNLYITGLYTSDGVFSATAKSTRPGVMAILKGLGVQ